MIDIKKVDIVVVSGNNNETSYRIDIYTNTNKVDTMLIINPEIVSMYDISSVSFKRTKDRISLIVSLPYPFDSYVIYNIFLHIFRKILSKKSLTVYDRFLKNLSKVEVNFSSSCLLNQNTISDLFKNKINRISVNKEKNKECRVEIEEYMKVIRVAERFLNDKQNSV